MRILYLGNNWVGWQVLEQLREQGEQVVGLVIHPERNRKYGDNIVEAAGLSKKYIFDGSTLRQPEVLNAIRALEPDICLSILFGYILKPEFISVFPEGVVNLHPAYLPYNRGQYPNVWSIVEGTPAGVTLHFIDQDIDTGDIIAQREVPVEVVDTGLTLYRKLEKASYALFVETWPQIRAGDSPRKAQTREEGAFHFTADVEQIDAIDLDKRYQARELIDIMRARTFPPYPGAYFMKDGRKIFLRLTLLDEDQLDA